MPEMLAQVFTKGPNLPISIPNHGPDANTSRLVIRALLTDGAREVRFERLAVD